MNTKITLDGNTATSKIAYALSEVIAIYPITPSSSMGELAEEWSLEGQKNILGGRVDVIEMQSEAGAAGALHGSLVAGALSSTFTASQGLLLMIPDMHKIAGELLPMVMHVSSRALAAQSLSIFGDHSDVMSCRNTGFAMLAANNVQETMDMALIAHIASLKSKIPFLHFFDGFRTSHEIQKINDIDEETIKKLFPYEAHKDFRTRAMRPEAPVVRVAAQNPDVYFQGREASNKYYNACTDIVVETMNEFAKLTGRSYKPFEYFGDPDAENIIVAIGSACDTIEQTLKYLSQTGQKLGLLKVHLYRPFATELFIAEVPESCKKIAVLDRSKEPGSAGEALYLDTISALMRQGHNNIKVIGGRYGLSSKEFTPNHVQAIYQHLEQNESTLASFTVGINDDVTHLSLQESEQILQITPSNIYSSIFWGLGSDGTVGANKNSIKIIGNNTDLNVQGYFYYDSKKAFGITISHLRFGKSPIRLPYLISDPDFVACHHPMYMGYYPVLDNIENEGSFLLNSSTRPEKIFTELNKKEQDIIIDRKIKFYCIDANKIARKTGLGNKINIIMQTAFFKITQIIDLDLAIKFIKQSIEQSYGRKGQDLVELNYRVVEQSLENLHAVEIPLSSSLPAIIPEPAKIGLSEHDSFVNEVLKPVMHMQGDKLPVSKISVDGTLPLGTSQLEKRGMSSNVAHWIPENCIQCNICVMSCPHSVIRAKQIDEQDLEERPETFKTLESNTFNGRDLEYRIQISTEDCTGCSVCVDVCPAKEKALSMVPIEEERAAKEPENTEYFRQLPSNVIDGAKIETPKGVGFLEPYFEFHSACAGCGETPYIKLLTQLFGARMMIANATGCSSIYGGSFPTIPFVKDENGRGPTWGNSLFEDNAEYGLGMRLAVDSNRSLLYSNIEKLMASGPEDLVKTLRWLVANKSSVGEEAYHYQQKLARSLEKSLKEPNLQDRDSYQTVADLVDYIIDKSVWAIGGDGWAYDIGYGGLDHVLAKGRNINMLVLDTEAYANTGGQASKATPLGAIAKFSSEGSTSIKKNLGLMAMSYGHIYVASVSMGANRTQVLKAFLEAEAYDGPSLILAYSPCIAHGIDMSKTQSIQKLAVNSGYFHLYRFNPQAKRGERFSWDAKEAKFELAAFLDNERRYSNLKKISPALAEKFYAQAQKNSDYQYELMSGMAKLL